jgi:hypothetical protein
MMAGRGHLKKKGTENARRLAGVPAGGGGNGAERRTAVTAA